MRSSQKNRISIAIVCGIALITGCLAVGPLMNVSITQTLDGATSVKALIQVASGTLVVGGGATALLEAIFLYNVAAWSPEISYAILGGEGDLQVRQPNTVFPATGGIPQNDWTLNFSDTVPLDLSVESASGNTDLDLSSLNLTALDVSSASGDLAIDLGGEMAMLAEVDVQASAGTFSFSLTGNYTVLGSVNISTASGTSTINLAGGFAQSVNVVVDIASGGLTLRVPADVGVRVDASSVVGAVTNNGLQSQGDRIFTNAAFDPQAVGLQVELNGVAGQVTLELVT